MSLEKPLNPSWVFRSTIHWSFRVLMLAVVIGLALFWGIDTFDVTKAHQDLLTTTNFITKNITTNFNSTAIPQNLTKTSSPQVPQVQQPLNKKNLSWVSVELDSNYSTNLFSRWMTPGGEPCKDSTTEDIFINGIDNGEEHGVIELTSGVIHEYVFQAVDGSGSYRCLGGDYFEIDLSSDKWKSRPPVQDFGNGANDAAAFWSEVLDGVRRRNVVVPEVVYRTTVATGGYARRLVFNPSKMEAFNGVFVDKLRQFGVIDYIVDHFDMTYPWHYDNRCNDGVHYGRFPAKARWRDGQIGHQYFVDLMLCHVLLNVLCSK